MAFEVREMNMRLGLIVLFLGSLLLGCSSNSESIDPSPTAEISQNFNMTNSTEEADTVEEEADEFEDDFGDEFEEEFGDTEENEVWDPLEGYNRLMTDFNDGFQVYVFVPVTDGYKAVVPEGVRNSIGNFFKNLLFPVRFFNNVLQLKLMNAGEEFARFGINTTIGFFGFFDPAKSVFGLQEHPEDFGQTLGHYGVGGGFHLVLPFLGTVQFT